MGKKSLALIFVTLFTIFTLVSCGNSSASNSMTDDELKIYELLCEKAQNFCSPTSVKLINSSDVFCVDKDDEKDFILREFVDSDGYYYWDYCWNTRYRLVKLQIVADTKGGGTDNKVYCVNLDFNPNEEQTDSLGEYNHASGALGKMWSYDEATEKFVATLSDDTYEAEQENLIKNMQKDSILTSINEEYGLTELAESGEYPMSIGNTIDIAKINKALDEHWKELGIK